ALSWRGRARASSPPPLLLVFMPTRRSRRRTGAVSSPATWSQSSLACSMQRSELTIDLGAVRRNVKRLLDVLEGAQLWAVVKANGYGHGAVDVAGAALGAGASVLCVATVPEGLALREKFGETRILVMGPTATRGKMGSSPRSTGEAGSRRCGCSARGRAPATAGASWPSGRPGSESSRSATRTASAAT